MKLLLPTLYPFGTHPEVYAINNLSSYTSPDPVTAGLATDDINGPSFFPREANNAVVRVKNNDFVEIQRSLRYCYIERGSVSFMAGSRWNILGLTPRHMSPLSSIARVKLCAVEYEVCPSLALGDSEGNSVYTNNLKLRGPLLHVSAGLGLT